MFYIYIYIYIWGCSFILAHIVAPYLIEWLTVIGIMGKSSENTDGVGSVIPICVDQPDRPVHRKQLLLVSTGLGDANRYRPTWNTMVSAFWGGGPLRVSPRLAPPRSEESLLELQTDSKPMTEHCQRMWSRGTKLPWLCIWVKLRQLAQETPHFPASVVARCTFYCPPFNWCNHRPALPRGLLNSPVVVCKYHLSLALALELGDVFGMLTSFSTELNSDWLCSVHLTYSGLWHHRISLIWKMQTVLWTVSSH